MQFSKSIEKDVFSPVSVESVLQTRLSDLETLLNQKLKALKKAPEGTLRVSKSNGVIQYYHKEESSGEHGNYIPVKNSKLVQELAQKEYDSDIVSLLQQETRVLKRLIHSYGSFLHRFGTVEQLFGKLNKTKQKLVKPLFLLDEEFAVEWSELPYKGKDFAPDQPEHFTMRGERVRSKSEVIIADTLTRLKNPYRYEYPIEIVNGPGDSHAFYPDFLCLNLKKRQEFIWEHFGMMDNPEYAASAARKLRIYEKNSIFPGKNLIITMETSDLPINAKQVEKVALQYLAE